MTKKQLIDSAVADVVDTHDMEKRLAVLFYSVARRACDLSESLGATFEPEPVSESPKPAWRIDNLQRNKDNYNLIDCQMYKEDTLVGGPAINLIASDLALVVELLIDMNKR